MSSLAKIKRQFFRKDTVGRYLKRKTFKVLSMFGGNVRKAAQRSMKPGGKKGRVASAGESPRTHDKKLLRKLLFYSLDKNSESVVVGPLKLSRTAKLGVPLLLEEGGRIATQEKGETVVRQYHEHPYMIPAFNLFIPKVASWYKQR